MAAPIGRASQGVRARSETLRQAQLRLRRGYPDLDAMRIRIDDLLSTASERLRQRLAVSSERFDGLRRRLDSANPRDILRRGYAVVQNRDGDVVTDATQVDAGDPIAVTLAVGVIGAAVTSVRKGQDA